MKTTRTVVLLIFHVCSCIVGCAQDWKEIAADELFQLARKEVFEGRRPAGQEKLRFILEKSPSYIEVKIFLARTYAWDGNYNESRILLQKVLYQDPTNLAAHDALIDVELWSDNNSDAANASRAALLLYPSNTIFLYKQASALHSVGKPNEARDVLVKLLQIDPTHEKGLQLMSAIKKANKKFTVATTYGVDFFSRTFNPAYAASIQVGRANSWGSSIVRVNHAHRFNKDGFQFETDLYPGIAKGVYAYLNYGFSTNSLFPEHRSGAELYFSLPKGLEASAGTRYMYFDRDTKVIIYTGSIGWYHKDFWISIRPFITPDPEEGTSMSGSFSVRKYAKDAETYIGLSAGIGFSPDLRTLQRNTGLSENEIYVLKSQRTGVTWQRSFGEAWSINIAIDVARQELSFDQGSYVLIAGTSATLRKKL